ncbi:MAG: type II toxin-antitoxin system VapC family toxin [Acidimicrobiales bacterium]
MIVVDASAAISALLNAGPARRALGESQLHVPHLIDTEVANGLRRLVVSGEIDAAVGWNALDTWRHLGLIRYPVFSFLDRVWQLRGNVSSYDACYVALAENLGSTLVTADARISRVPLLKCAVTVVPR